MSAAMSRKRKSPEPERDALNEDHITTPSNSPARKKLKITQNQKQTLIDNLQLESTLSFSMKEIPCCRLLTVSQSQNEPADYVLSMHFRRRIFDLESKDELTAFLSRYARPLWERYSKSSTISPRHNPRRSRHFLRRPQRVQLPKSYRETQNTQPSV
jgi:hypothetical protein